MPARELGRQSSLLNHLHYVESAVWILPCEFYRADSTGSSLRRIIRAHLKRERASRRAPSLGYPFLLGILNCEGNKEERFLFLPLIH